MEAGPTVKALGIAALASLAILTVMAYQQQRPKLVFCDVGQGDAAYIRTAEGTDIMVDAGPGESVSECLGRNMPFWDRTVELAFLTHPQKDHMEGYVGILSRYRVNTFVMPQVSAESALFQTFTRLLADKGTRIVYGDSSVRFHIGDHTDIMLLWPTADFLHKTIPGALGTSRLGTTDTDLNDFSLIFSFMYHGRSVLFTGDASPWVLNLTAETMHVKADILKVPHHGSKNGLTEYFLKAANPSVAIISCGVRNRYHHPSPEVVTMLEDNGVDIRRTDVDGSIVIYLDSLSGKKKIR